MRNLSLAVIVLFVCGCATTAYEPFIVEGFEERTSQHETVAILPFDVTIIMDELPEDQTEADIAAQEQQEANAYQQSLYGSLLQRSGEDGYRVTFQDVATTNTTLERADIAYRDINSSYTKAELCSLLGVDAVISGAISRSRPMGAGGAIATAMITGILSGGVVTANPNTNRVNVAAMIHDGEGDEALWSYDRESGGGVGTSPESMIESLLAGIAATFPYVQQDNEEN